MRHTSMILRTDSYKFSHGPVMPEGTEFLYSYLSSRGGLFKELPFVKLRYYLKEYLCKQITQADVDYAAIRVPKHMGPVFNRELWQHVVDDHNGYLPLRIKAVREGTVVPVHNVMMTMENTCPKCQAVTNPMETLLLKLWYPITVAALSREIKKVIKKYMEETGGDMANLPFKLHDFGYRGVSSEESAAIGGAAHLLNFLGSDTFIANEFLNEYYGVDMASYSIPATEHSVMCSRGPAGEVYQMERFLDIYGSGPYPAIACVSDTYNIFNACENYWGGELKAKVEKMNDKVLVIRPDSGDPVTVVTKCLQILDEKFGSVVRDGFKILNHVRIIQGDGITLSTIEAILQSAKLHGFSADNLVFGMGGALLQQVHRDTQKFAIKASSYVINGRRYDYKKDPITDKGKASFAGRLKLILEDGEYKTVSADTPGEDQLVLVYENGVMYNQEDSWETIRARAEV